MFRACSLAVAVAVGSLGASLSASGAANLVVDGQFEEVRRETLFRSPYLEQAVKDGVRLSREGEEVILPANFDQFCGAEVVKVVEGAPGGTVHSGKRALLLKGGMYLRGAEPRSYATKEGDLYQVEFYAKGEGDVSAWFTVYGTGKTGAVQLERRGKAVPSQWTKIEQTFLIVGAGAQEIFPRLAAAHEVLIDDLVIRRISGDRPTAAGEPAGPRDRFKSAFVYPLKTSAAAAGIDDPCWQDVPEFSGFLDYGDQSFFAEPAASMKLGYDATSLYVRVACAEPDMSILSRLDAYQDLATPQYIGPTAVEVFLDPGCSRLTWYQFSVTARGHRFQAFSRAPGAWSAAWEAKAQTGPNGYTVLLQVPFATLGVSRPDVGDVWGLNVCRNRDTFHSTWAPVGPDFHSPAGFGQLVFGSFRQWRREAFARQTIQIRGEILDRARRPGMADLAERVKLVDDYAGEVQAQMESSGSHGPADWRQMASLYAMGGFVLDSYRRILVSADWRLLGQGISVEGDKR
jgi:hypothetical protein